MCKNQSLFWLRNYSSWIFTPWFGNSNKNPSRPSQGDPYMSTVFTLQYEGLMKLTVFAFLIISESLQSTLPRKKESGRAAHMCFYNVIVWSNSIQTAQDLCLRRLWGPISLSIHFFIGFRWFPPSPPLRGPHLITDHHSHLACVPFQLSAQFLSDDPREPQARWPRLESPNRSLSHPSRFCAPTPDADPLPAHSDPEWKADASVACYMTCDIRITQWHKRMPGIAAHPTMALVCCLFITIQCLKNAIVQFYRMN